MIARLLCLLPIVVCGIVVSLNIAYAEVAPHRGKDDPRVRTVQYNPANVVAVEATPGVSTMIIFDDTEKIETVAVGDSVSWKIEPNKKGNVLFLKPIEFGAVTNMNVVTDKNVYSFVLRARSARSGDQVFVIRFSFDHDNDPLLAEAKRRAAQPNLERLASASLNYAYSYRGDKALKPVSLFDDGTKTWFKFSGDIPAVFLVENGKDEVLINFRREGDYLVVDKVARQWMLRQGKRATCIFATKINTQATLPKRPFNADTER